MSEVVSELLIYLVHRDPFLQSGMKIIDDNRTRLTVLTVIKAESVAIRSIFSI